MGDQPAQATTLCSLACQARLYEEYGRGNRAAVLDALDETVVWTSCAGPEVPWGGTWHGRAGVEEFFARLDEAVRLTGYVVDRVIADGEWVTVLATGRAQVLATGQDLVLAKTDVMRFRDGRILEFREYYDTAAVLAALQAQRAG
jgi:ketosteroid isomerase-like protein